MKGKSPGRRVLAGAPGSLVLVRKATAADLPALLANLRKVVRERVYTWTERVGEAQRARLLATMGDRRSLSIVAQRADTGEIVGQLSLTPLGDVVKARHVRNLSLLVVDGHRGQGVGSALLEHAIDWARSNPGVEKIQLDVFSTNARAIALYKKMGFEVEGVSRREYLIGGAYVDDVKMGIFPKELGASLRETH
jgi:RimJ/RimL family protein N-acetyltransferase